MYHDELVGFGTDERVVRNMTRRNRSYERVPPTIHEAFLLLKAFLMVLIAESWFEACDTFIIGIRTDQQVRIDDIRSQGFCRFDGSVQTLVLQYSTDRPFLAHMRRSRRRRRRRSTQKINQAERKLEITTRNLGCLVVLLAVKYCTVGNRSEGIHSCRAAGMALMPPSVGSAAARSKRLD